MSTDSYLTAEEKKDMNGQYILAEQCPNKLSTTVFTYFHKLSKNLLEIWANL